jgi:hypothetical protein
MADEMPPYSKFGRSLDFLQPLLNAVLAEFDLPGLDGRPDVAEAERFRDREKAYLRGIAAGRPRCPFEAGADDGEVLPDRAYFLYALSASKFDCASFAFGPLGASLR